MAKQTSSTSVRLAKAKTKRKGVHSKKKASVSKNAKHYLKRNVGQGK